MKYDALREFFIKGSRIEVSKNEYIIRPEETPSGVFYIESGFVKSSNTTKYGEENLLVLRKPDEIFPLIWTVTGDNRHVAYIAHTDCVLYRKSLHELEEAKRTSTAILEELLLATTAMYQVQAERVHSLLYRTVRERILYFLRVLAARFGEDSPEGILISIPLTRNDIASSVSATRETVSREFSGLTRKGIISQKSGRILIKRPEELDKVL